MKIVIGSRGSKLALLQSELVKKALQQLDPSLQIEIKAIKTKGDRILDKPLTKIGDKGLFTKEIEKALLDETIDLAVHSLKDMPTDLPDHLMFTGTIKGEDPRDCLVLKKGLKQLPQNAIVATGSARRKLQLLKLRPDLKIIDIRGNVLTRLEKLDTLDIDALVLASAGLKRLNLEHRISHYFSYEDMVPASGQGILAIEVKKGSKVIDLINQIVDFETTERMKLERSFIETLQCGCHAPAGCHVEFINEDIKFDAVYGKEEKIKTYHGIIKDDYQNEIIKIANHMKG